MFTSTLNSSWDERSRRGLTTLTSFGVQALVRRRIAAFAVAAPHRIAFAAPTFGAGQSGSTSGGVCRSHIARERKRCPEQSYGDHSENAYANSDLAYRLRVMMVRRRLGCLVPTLQGLWELAVRTECLILSGQRHVRLCHQPR